MARRDEEKKRRRQKRLEKRDASSREVSPARALADAFRALKVPPPDRWPGAGDPSLSRPDLVKFDLADVAIERQPGKAKLKQLEARLLRGPIGYLPDIGGWAMEEILYHGLPGDPWNPIDHFLEKAGDRFPPRARDQIRLWKQARIGMFELGAVEDDTVGLREWDPTSGTVVGPTIRAITLNIGGVNAYRDQRGQIALTYLAPWAPEQGLFCGMGFGLTADRREAGAFAAYLALGDLEAATAPWPWDAGRDAARDHLERWRAREWHGWFQERMRFPFQALVPVPPRGVPALRTIKALIPSTPEQAYQIGIYFEVPHAGEVMVAGATTLKPVDIRSPNMAALAEYQAYRKRVGPPPGMADQPQFTRLR